ncbi:cell division protein ZapA [Methylobacterium sp. Leaf104]|uniref:cell division protein ZapA n=1 Tax=Methylobacterium TaxID=407 RepID=UPI0007019074|nr:MULTISPECIES: cell division protein ZapA [Methylobacterium]KQP31223.1 cell division protein ZapA [Methylobacterium sp. Leaf104]MCI9881321.1 cell division protein ZapA [Methylobacterium goesingense]
MPQINVTIDGKNYRMACADGEEAHLTALAEGLDGRITEMRRSFGEIGDMRLHVMAALMQADELQEAQGRLAALEQEVAALRATVETGESLRAAEEERLAEGLVRCAERIERLAHVISAG